MGSCASRQRCDEQAPARFSTQRRPFTHHLDTTVWGHTSLHEEGRAAGGAAHGARGAPFDNPQPPNTQVGTSAARAHVATVTSDLSLCQLAVLLRPC
jgi:hypothetical protein